MRIEEVDARDEAAFARWFAAVDAWQRTERPGEPGWLEHELREKAVQGTGPDPDEQIVLLTAVEDDQLLAVARLAMPRRDNTHLCDLLLLNRSSRPSGWSTARGAGTPHACAATSQQVQAMDRSFFAAGAVHRPTGRMVASTTMGIPRALPERAYQWDTLVLAEHRGPRLGSLVKLACLQGLAEESPPTRWISTWSAQESAPMIRVNEALGARVNGQIVNWQKRL